MTTLLSAITAIWTAISSWIVTTTTSLQSLFWDATNSSLTFLGTLAVIGVGIAIVFLIVGVIQRFLHLRG